MAYDDWQGFDDSGNTPLPDGPLSLAYAPLVPHSTLDFGDPRLASYFGTHEGGLVRSWLSKGGCTTIGDVLAVTEAQILAWPGIGVGKRDKILDLVGRLAADAAAGQLGPSGQPPATPAPPAEAPAASPWSTPEVGRDLLIVQEWGRFAARAATVGAVEASLRDRTLPADVDAALDRLRALPADLPPETDPGDVVLAWIDALEPRDRDIFESRIVKVRPQTLDAIGAAHGVTRERIRQLEVRLAEKAHQEFSSSSAWRQVRWAGFLLTDELGAFAPRHLVDTRSSTGEELFERHLLLWFVGLRATPGGIVADGFSLPGIGEVPFLEDGLCVDVEALTADLVGRGVRPAFVDFAIDAIDGLTRADGVVVRWGRSAVDKACALLAARGQAMALVELSAILGGSERSLRQRLFDDERLTRLSRTTVGLRAWGGEEYGGVVDAMMRRLDEHGELDLAELADDLAAQFDVAPTSVVMYSAAPVFATGGGRIRLRGADEPFVPRAQPWKVAGLFQASPDVMIWNLTVDADILRGSGRAAPYELGTFVGISPGMRIELSNPTRDYPMSWMETSHTGPQVGSLKPHAEALAASAGDVLRLRFDRRDRSVSVTLRGPAPLETDTAARVAWLTGLTATQTTSRAAIADAVHLDPGALDEALRKRGEADVADAVLTLPT
ncbi:MAG TPA: sigma factor-like helix-turn-helix DNA-binding protein [Nocardioides sp.]